MSERPYNAGRVPKLVAAHAAVVAAEKALREAGMGLAADTVRDVGPQVKSEEQSCRAWAEEDTRPYYGG
jgi:hypothetical protein